MSAAILARPEASAVGFRQVDPHGRFQLSFGPRPSIVLELVRMVVQARLDGGSHRLAAFIDRRFSKPRRIPWVTGSSLLVRRSAFDAVGGFDESFFLYFEDADFCLRLSRDVGPVYYLPGVTVIHERGASARQSGDKARRAYRESQRLYWLRYRGPVVARFVQLYQRLRGT
jgi:GT2 family glycosyltransferase